MPLEFGGQVWDCDLEAAWVCMLPCRPGSGLQVLGKFLTTRLSFTGV